jgi:hypothetical protein
VNGDLKLRHLLWRTFFAAFKEACSSVIDLALSLIEIGLARSVGETAHVLADVFHVIPEELVSILLHKLSVFKPRAAPSPAQLSASFIDANIALKRSPRQIFAACAVSQILMDISRAEFDTLFKPSLPSLVFFAVIMDHIEKFNIRGFHALLGSILDTAILKLGYGASSMTKKLNILHRANLLIQATTTDPTYAIHLQSETQCVLCMDGETVETVSDAC